MDGGDVAGDIVGSCSELIGGGGEGDGGMMLMMGGVGMGVSWVSGVGLSGWGIIGGMRGGLLLYSVACL